MKASASQFDEFGIGSFVLAFADESANRAPASQSPKWISTISYAPRVRSSPQLTTLLDSLGFSPADVEHIAVAGGIGSGINFKNAIRIGMFPDVPLEKYRYIGNSSLAGAYAALISKAAALRLHELSKSMTYMELSVQHGYMDAFTAACFLPHTNGELFPSAKAECSDNMTPGYDAPAIPQLAPQGLG